VRACCAVRPIYTRRITFKTREENAAIVTALIPLLGSLEMMPLPDMNVSSMRAKPPVSREEGNVLEMPVEKRFIAQRSADVRKN